MNRRKAIIGLVGLTGAATASYFFYTQTKQEDLNQLDSNKLFIAELAETIIPRTTTPGAKDAKAEEIIILWLKECTDRKTRNNFIRGLEKLKSRCQAAFDKDFMHCSAQERQALLNQFEKEEKPFAPIFGKIQKKFLGTAFMPTLKEYTTKAYCTSFLGATQGLAYVLIPSRREACIPLQTSQKSWATQ